MSGKTQKPENKEGNRKGKRPTPVQLPAHLQEAFDTAVKEAAGKPLSMAPGSPLGQLIGSFVEACLQEEMQEHLGYPPHQRLESVSAPEQSSSEQSSSEQSSSEVGSARRSNTRNGYSSKQLKTSVGVSQIVVPRDRTGEFIPRILPKHQSMSAEIEERVVAMYASGMSTRDIAEHVRELYHFSATEDFVSNLTARLDPQLAAWRARALEATYAIVYIDAVHLKVRHPNGVCSTAVYIISGYGDSGIQEILGIWIAPSEHSSGHGESASYWQTIFVELHNRGLKQVLIACSDLLTGLEQALAAVYPDAEHLPCVVHLMRASLARVTWQHRRAIAAELRRIYQAVSFQQAEQALTEFEQQHPEHPAIVRLWQQALPRLAPLWGYSSVLRRMVYTTNPQENINRQIRKVTKSRGSMPSIDSALRLVTLIAMKIDQRAAERDRVRHDWPKILTELHIHFAARIPEDWGYRS